MKDIFLLLFLVACGQTLEIVNIQEPNGEKFAYFQCKSNSANNPSTCVLSGHDEVDEIVSVEALDVNACKIDIDIGIQSPTTLWVKDLCNGWVKVRLRD